MPKDNSKTVDAFYEELMEFAFDRPGDINSWAWDLDRVEPEAPPAVVTAAITRLCNESAKDLESFTNLQVAGGLKYIFDNSFSDYSFDLLRDELPAGMRYAFFKSLSTLYAQCFALRCAPVLLHGVQVGHENPLNAVCYMFWDVSPISLGGDYALSAMEQSLYLDNVACIESGLHGLGHKVHRNENRIQAAIDKFLRSRPKIGEELREYALAARTGYVN